MNQINIIGNLTADPVGRTNADGKFVCNFTVAVNRRRTAQNQNPEADFFRVAAWNQRGETCQKYLAKGKKVMVTGPVSVRTYQAQDGSTRASMEIVAQDVEFLSSGNNTESAPAQTTQAPAGNVQPNMTVIDDPEGLPF